MMPYLISATGFVLTPWGSPEDIGAETVTGPISVAGRFDIGGPLAAVFGGLFSATRGVYLTTYAFHEHASLIEGSLALTDEASGQRVVYAPGDAWVIEQGTQVRWEILSDKILKSYIAVVQTV